VVKRPPLSPLAGSAVAFSLVVGRTSQPLLSVDNRSRYACILTIQQLFVESLWNQNPACYLHTLTFANPEPEVSEAMRRLNSFGNWLRKTGKVAVRVIERGGESGRVHYHLVSSQKWSSKEMWSVLPKYGFGRYDVRCRPIERAYYAAKYVGKKNHRFPLPYGTRSWGVIGMKGVTRKSVEISKKELALVANSPQLVDVLTWKATEITSEITLRLRTNDLPPGECEIIKMLELKKHQQADVCIRLQRGDFGGVGEYRGCVVRTLEVADKQNPSNKVKRVVVEHNVEHGGMPCTVQEWLPPGSTPEAVKAPASKGDVVFVTISRFDSKFGSNRTCSGSIFALNTLPL